MTNIVELTIPAEYLGVLKLFAADRDIRYYLNGIAVEIGRTESRLIATDAHRLGVFRIESDQPMVSAPVVHIIPNDLLAHIKPSKGEVEITIGPAEPLPHAPCPITLRQNGTDFRGMTIGGRFPDWRRVIPCGELSEVAAQFSPEHLVDLYKAARILPGPARRVDVGYNGYGPAVINLCEHPDFVGVLMPPRGGSALKIAPAWVFLDLREDYPPAEAA